MIQNGASASNNVDIICMDIRTSDSLDLGEIFRSKLPALKGFLIP